MAGARTSVVDQPADGHRRGRVAGTVIGVLTGYLRGWVDRVMMAFNDALLAFPGILLALGLLAVVGANKYGIIAGARPRLYASVARIVRGTVLSLREKEFIEASRVMGNSELFTMLRHIAAQLPGAAVACWPPRMFGWVLLAESALELPRPGRAAAGADLGQHAGRQPALYRTRRSGSASSPACASR